MTHPYERLGAFYLGKRVGEPHEHVVVPSSDFTTHAVCVGMTGSGKTGLCLALLEEAAIDGVPVLAIDPKGDLANLALAFPSPSGSALAPFVDADAARRAGKSVEELAESEAERLRRGLAGSDQDLDRARLLREASDVVVYTPGSEAGVPLALLRTLDAPDPKLRASAEALRERIGTTVTAILGLAGVEADPVKSRGHVLVSSILADAWGRGATLDLPALVRAVQTPPFSKIGVLDLASFYPPDDRFELVLALNNLLASPAASALMHGEAPDPGALLYGPTGRPRVAIVSVAHLGDGERRAFVTMLLGNLLSWMRAQPGTSSLRALFYMDEVAGYLPPVANPPTKPLFLTLFKQARAFGLGMVVATQNPVDVDYKVLSNAGTWLVGRLQTERDRERVMEGLRTAAEAVGGAAAVDAYARAIAGLETRQFLYASARGGPPFTFSSRFCLSYLRGPMSLAEIARLPKPDPSPVRAAATVAHAGRPTLPPDVTQMWVPLAAPHDGTPVGYAPSVLGVARVRLTDKKAGIDTTLDVMLAASVDASLVGVDWQKAYALSGKPEALRATAEVDPAQYQEVPSAAQSAERHAAFKKSFVEHLLRACTTTLFAEKLTGLRSTPRETERDFRIRLADALRAERDGEASKLRDKIAPKLARIEEKIRKAQQKLDKEQADAQGAMASAAVGVGAGVLGALLGRGVVTGANARRAASAAKGVGRARTQRADVERARADLDAARAEYAALEADTQAKFGELAKKYDPTLVALTEAKVAPKKTQIEVIAVGVGYLPYRAVGGQWVAGWG